MEKLYEWNKDNKLSFHFVDVHSLSKLYDSSRYCSIKNRCLTECPYQKTFILIVGLRTNEVTKGTHIAMKCKKNTICGSYTDWDYQAVKNAIME